MVTLPRETLAQANLSVSDEVVTIPVQDGVLVKAKNSVSGAMLQALKDDMDCRADVYRILAR